MPDGERDVIVAGQIEIGLQNLKRKFEQSDRKESSLRALVEEHFAFALGDNKSPLPTLVDALPQLRPQIMPTDYADRLPIITFPVGKSLVAGPVLDDERQYTSLKREDADRWQETPGSLFERAINNLDRASSDLELQVHGSKEVRLIGIEKNDGYDAARILIPRLRSFIAERIGSPFYFGIPNRDFLVCWNTCAPEQFGEIMKKKLKEDFEARPYPLSPNIFEVDAGSNIIEHTTGRNRPLGADGRGPGPHRHVRRSRRGVR
jgi:hypothetical protein